MNNEEEQNIDSSKHSARSHSNKDSDEFEDPDPANT